MLMQAAVSGLGARRGSHAGPIGSSAAGRTLLVRAVARSCGLLGLCSCFENWLHPNVKSGV